VGCGAARLFCHPEAFFWPKDPYELQNGGKSCAGFRLLPMKPFSMLVVGLAFGMVASAQEHKISVQKFETPQYPPIGRAANVEGEVRLRFNVLSSGEVQNVQALRGHPILA